jgi:Outer membrane protein beta-barrel domain
MKKILLTVFVFLLSIFFSEREVLAQDSSSFGHKLTPKDNSYQPSMHIRGGVIFGINAAQIDGDDYAGYHKVGLNFGFYGDLPISKIFFVSTEILYSEKGANNPVTPNTPVQYYYTWKLQYAEIPELFHFQDKKAFNVGAGFSYSRLVGEQLSAAGELQPPVDICTGTPPDPSLLDPKFLCLKRSDWDVVAEANYLPLKHLAINVRFAYSLPAMGYFGGSNYVKRGMYNNLLTFRLMWIFGS